jgi:hypothetical protein
VLFPACALKMFESMKLNHLVFGNEFATDKNIIFAAGNGKDFSTCFLVWLSLAGKISRLLSSCCFSKTQGGLELSLWLSVSFFVCFFIVQIQEEKNEKLRT